jgi:formylmethanofuran dehydrogenase subunit B
MSATVESRAIDAAPSLPLGELTDVTCLACGCLCDDIAITVRDNQILEARRACAIGQSYFSSHNGPHEGPIAAIDGEPAELAQAIDRAAAILNAARRPLIWGLSQTTIETQAAAVALADQVGAVIVLGHENEARAHLRAVQRVGVVSATLGEVKARADVVVFWGVDPAVTHPRHFERYSVEPRGRFVPDGRAGRTIIVVDSRRTATAERADHFFEVTEAQQFASLWVLRALIRGSHVDSARVSPMLRSLAELLQGARYGAMFHGPALSGGPGGQAKVEALLLLVRSLNAVARFVALPLGGPGNPTGAEAVLGWQSGYTLCADFSRGFPLQLTRESSAHVLLESGEHDVALIVSDDPRQLSPTSRQFLERIPTILIHPNATQAPWTATVALNSAVPGIHHGGTVLRADGVMLPLRKVLETPRPTDREYLESLHQRLQILRMRS